ERRGPFGSRSSVTCATSAQGGRSQADTCTMDALAAKPMPGETAAAAAPARWFAERQPIDMDAQYRVQGLPLWLRCRVLEICTQGAGLLLVDELTAPMRNVVIELRPPGRTGRIVLHAEVRDISLADGHRRIGVEFSDMGPLDESAVCELMARHGERRD